MRSAGVAAAVLLVLLGPAYAADAPNIVGLWTPVEHAGSNLSIAPMDDMRLRVDTPHFSNRPGTEAWSVRIDTQSGRAFGGAVVSKGGKEQVLLGTFRSDGKRVVYATDFSSGDGEVSADSMELCWVDSVPNYIATACTTYERAKPAPAAPAGK
ncbi:hypothetical protein [Roseixanthobacter glucoisosaccharinicivorans]|uniref:hypothetical protein n=1 Tax=Roseixanthobacter glucoisosaccharinicivorans TaxID=3119923 RepID=UPI00372CA057